MNLFVRCLFAIAFVFTSVTQAALALRPIATTPDGKSVIGCHYYKQFSKQKKYEAVVYRSHFGLDPDWSFSVHEGAVLVLLGVDDVVTAGKGVVGKFLTIESGDTLSNRPGEDWTAAAPGGAFFSARGYYTGFFLSARPDGPIEGTLAQSFDFIYDRVEMSCTDDEAILRKWIAQVAAYAPY